jgi:hypothetical protein
MSDYDQFKPEPAVDVSPSWPPAPTGPLPTSGPHDMPVPAPQLDAYTTPAGDTIIECAVCIGLEQYVAEPNDELDGGRPYRAVTYVNGTAVCRPHLRGLVDDAVDAAIVAVRYAIGLQ